MRQIYDLPMINKTRPRYAVGTRFREGPLTNADFASRTTGRQLLARLTAESGTDSISTAIPRQPFVGGFEQKPVNVGDFNVQSGDFNVQSANDLISQYRQGFEVKSKQRQDIERDKALKESEYQRQLQILIMEHEALKLRCDKTRRNLAECKAENLSLQKQMQTITTRSDALEADLSEVESRCGRDRKEAWISEWERQRQREETTKRHQMDEKLRMVEQRGAPVTGTISTGEPMQAQAGTTSQATTTLEIDAPTTGSTGVQSWQWQPNPAAVKVPVFTSSPLKSPDKRYISHQDAKVFTVERGRNTAATRLWDEDDIAFPIHDRPRAPRSRSIDHQRRDFILPTVEETPSVDDEIAEYKTSIKRKTENGNGELRACTTNGGGRPVIGYIKKGKF